MQQGPVDKGTVAAVRHVSYLDLGALEELLRAQGFRIRYVDVGIGDSAALDHLEADLVIVLGAPLHAYDTDKYAFIRREIALLEKRLSAGLPTLGIAFGAELMARALGVRVYPGPAPDIGWQPLRFGDAGYASPLRHLSAPVLQWRADLFDLPPGAAPLAATGAAGSDAFSHGRNALALQFHVEILAKKFERWLIGRAPELAAAGVSVTRLRADTARLARGLAAQGQHCIAEWLGQVEWPGR